MGPPFPLCKTDFRHTDSSVLLLDDPTLFGEVRRGSLLYPVRVDIRSPGARDDTSVDLFVRSRHGKGSPSSRGPLYWFSGNRESHEISSNRFCDVTLCRTSPRDGVRFSVFCRRRRPRSQGLSGGRLLLGTVTAVGVRTPIFSLFEVVDPVSSEDPYGRTYSLLPSRDSVHVYTSSFSQFSLPRCRRQRFSCD